MVMLLLLLTIVLVVLTVPISAFATLKLLARRGAAQALIRIGPRCRAERKLRGRASIGCWAMGPLWKQYEAQIAENLRGRAAPRARITFDDRGQLKLPGRFSGVERQIDILVEGDFAVFPRHTG
jgi:hypothetical protein